MFAKKILGSNLWPERAVKLMSNLFHSVAKVCHLQQSLFLTYSQKFWVEKNSIQILWKPSGFVKNCSQFYFFHWSFSRWLKLPSMKLLFMQVAVNDLQVAKLWEAIWCPLRKKMGSFKDFLGGFGIIEFFELLQNPNADKSPSTFCCCIWLVFSTLSIIDKVQSIRFERLEQKF